MSAQTMAYNVRNGTMPRRAYESMHLKVKGCRFSARVPQLRDNRIRVAAFTSPAIQFGVDQPLAVYIGALPASPNAPVVHAGSPVIVQSPVAQSTEVPEPTPQEKKEIGALFDTWNAALQTRNPDIVAQLYAPDAILLPTVSNQVRTCYDSKVDYFSAFLQIQPFGTLEESYIRFLHPTKDIAANSGVYTFKIVKDGEESSVSARYSFIYRRVDGEWKIIEHHSSAMPEVNEDSMIAGLFDQWNAALQTGDAEEVAALYASDAILLPTVSNEVRIDHASRVDYFKSFLQLKPFGIIDNSYIRFLSPTIAANSGVYTFFINRDGNEASVTARFSFVYRKIGSKWMIIEHHSSAMPEVVTASQLEAAAAADVAAPVTAVQTVVVDEAVSVSPVVAVAAVAEAAPVSVPSVAEVEAVSVPAVAEVESTSMPAVAEAESAEAESVLAEAVAEVDSADVEEEEEVRGDEQEVVEAVKQPAKDDPFAGLRKMFGM